MNGSGIGILVALFMEAFVSIHMSLFVLVPLSKIISKENSRKTFWILFGIRAVILLFFDFFITTGIALVDFMAVFVGAFIVTPLSMVRSTTEKAETVKTEAALNKVLTSAAGPVTTTADANATETSTAAETPVKKAVSPNDFDPLFSMSENDCVEEFIQREMVRAGIGEDQKLIPEDMLRRKNILSVIFAVLLFIYLCLIFFHFPFATYAVGLVILVVYGNLTSRYRLMKYLKKEVKSRPQEKISNIVMSVKASLVPDYSKKLRAGLLVAATAGALLLFAKPRILYEQAADGVNVRFYAYGITNMTTVTIPETYKGEKIVGLRGNTFSNMPLLREVNLPDTITEIRGQAFKGCRSLVTVKLPDSLEYLGGEAFYGCSSLTEIVLPEGISEIRGSTFEECTSLQTIRIPDSVTRIGGHAFYGDSSLEEVLLSPDSRLQEIGSSAFRCCDSLTEITLPRNVYINERAFKETPIREIRYYD